MLLLWNKFWMDLWYLLPRFYICLRWYPVTLDDMTALPPPHHTPPTWQNKTQQRTKRALGYLTLYRKLCNISRTKSPNFIVPRIDLQLSLPNPIKTGVRSRMKMKLEQRRSEGSTILLPTKVRLILEYWRYLQWMPKYLIFLRAFCAHVYTNNACEKYCRNTLFRTGRNYYN